MNVLPDISLCDRVVINDAEVPLQRRSVIDGFLKMDPVFYGTQVVSEMNKAGWLDPTEDHFLGQLACGSH